MIMKLLRLFKLRYQLLAIALPIFDNVTHPEFMINEEELAYSKHDEYRERSVTMLTQYNTTLGIFSPSIETNKKTDSVHPYQNLTRYLLSFTNTSFFSQV